MRRKFAQQQQHYWQHQHRTMQYAAIFDVVFALRLSISAFVCITKDEYAFAGSLLFFHMFFSAILFGSLGSRFFPSSICFFRLSFFLKWKNTLYTYRLTPSSCNDRASARTQPTCIKFVFVYFSSVLWALNSIAMHCALREWNETGFMSSHIVAESEHKMKKKIAD